MKRFIILTQCIFLLFGVLLHASSVVDKQNQKEKYIQTLSEKIMYKPIQNIGIQQTIEIYYKR